MNTISLEYKTTPDIKPTEHLAHELVFKILQCYYLVLHNWWELTVRQSLADQWLL